MVGSWRPQTTDHPCHVDPDQARHRRDPSVSVQNVRASPRDSGAIYERYVLQNANLQEKIPTAIGCQSLQQLRFTYSTLMAYSA